jgi:hypothetical protein
VQQELDIPLGVENSFPNRFRVEEKDETYQLFWEQTDRIQRTELAYQISVSSSDGSLEDARVTIFDYSSTPTVEVEDGSIILAGRARDTRDTIDTPFDVDAIVINGAVIQVSDGFVFGGFLVDLDADQRFTGFLIKVDENGKNAQFLRIEDINDTLGIVEVLEDGQGRLFVYWATGGNYTISGVSADFSTAWARKFASDTPSTDVKDIRLSTNESTVYVAVEDNRRGEILAYDTATGASNVSASFNLTTILPPEFSTDPIGILPLENGDLLLSMTAREVNADNTIFIYALVDQFGTPIWTQESAIGEVLVPGAQTSDGGYLFVAYNDSNLLTVLKTNANGEVVDDCSAESRNVLAATDRLVLPLTIFPNPAQSDMLISFDANQNSASKISIYNLQGQLMLQQSIQTQQGTTAISLRVDELPVGMYILKVGTQYQPTFFQKIE